MDQTPFKSTDQRRLDQNNNKSNSNSSCSSDKNCNNQQKVNACSCTNISIMQLFHEMKQEFPKVPDNVVQQMVTENCHNRNACLEQLQKVVSSSMTTPTMYPSKSIHSSSNKNNNLSNSDPHSETQRSPINGTKWKGGVGRYDNSQMMKEMSERFENISISSSSEASTSSDMKIVKRPTTLPLRRAPDPPTHSRSSPPSATSTPSSTTSVSSFSTATTSSQMHHNVVLDSTASKINDSLNVQLNVKVSPISTKRPAPPPPNTKPSSTGSNNNQRYTSRLSVQPEPPYTSMIDPKNHHMMPLGGGASASTGTSGQRSYTNVKLTLRQPSSSSSLTPIDIQAGPQTLSYSSSSFNAQHGCESHLKITVANNGESCIQAVRTAKNAPEINQIDTTINIEGNYVINDDNSQYRIISNPFIPQQLKLPHSGERRLTEDELRQLIKRQMKQKESLECELEKEREKLQMIRLDIITLTSPVMTHLELKELCDEISRLRTVCGRLSDEIDVVTSPPRAIVNTYSPSAPPPIPRGLVSRKGHSPSHSLLPHLDTGGLRFPTHEPPSYNDVMRATERHSSIEDSNLINDDNKWTCSICTFRNHELLQICEACDMPRVQGIQITSSSFRPLQQHNQLQGSSVPSTNDNNSIVRASAH